MKRIPIAQLGWMAGVIDLKGKILRKTNKARATQQLVLMVESKDYAIVRELSRLTGTSPEMMRTPEAAKDWMRRSCLEHCGEAHVHVAAPVWPAIARWTVTGAAMAVVLWTLRGYLRTDRGLQAAMDQAIDQAAITGQGSGATRKSLRRLQYLGWEFPPAMEEKLRLVEGWGAGNLEEEQDEPAAA